MSGRITHLFGRINHVSDRLGWALSHLTWLAGLFVLADLVTRRQWVTNVEQFPVLSTALFALLLTATGLEAVVCKWKYRRVQGADSKNN